MKRIWVVLALTTLVVVCTVLIGNSVDQKTEFTVLEQIQASTVPNHPIEKPHSIANQAGINALGVQPSTPAASRPYEALIQDAPIVVHDETVKQGRIVRKTIYETEFKYPLILVEETFKRNETGEEELINGTTMVANHVMTRFPEGMTEAEVQQWVNSHGYTLLKKFRTTDLWLVQTPDTDVDALDHLMTACEKNAPASGKILAEPDYLFHSSDMPNDPSFGSLWGLHNTGQSGGTVDADIDALEAWDLAKGSHQVLVGVIDTGVDRDHSDLTANMWSNPNEIANNGIDDDNNGFIDDVYGWDFFADDNNPHDEKGHGTHCAGTIGAVGNNNIGVVGVSWNVSMVSIRFLGPTGSGSTSDAIDAVNYGTKINVDFTSNSWGGGGNSLLLKDAIATAGASNMLFVAAAGNTYENTDTFPHYPASYDLDNIISVASSDHNDIRSLFSSFGLVTVDLAAPGSSIYSTLPGESYGTKFGTSMAAPHVSGTVALIKSLDSEMDIAEIKQLIMEHVDPLPAFNGICVSGGRLNLRRTLENVRGPVVVQLPVDAVEGDGVLTNVGMVLLPESITSNVTVTLTSSDPSELLVPSNVVITAGATSAVFTVEVLDDTRLDGSQEVEVSPYLEGYLSENATMLVHDTEITTLHLSLPTYTFEGDSPFSGAVTVSSAPDDDVRILLESADPTEIVSGSVVLPAGQTAVVFELQAYDDNLIDGVQSAFITARVENWTNSVASILVYDNEKTRLDLQIPESAFEGEGVLTNAGVVSVPGVVTSDIQINLISSDTTEAIVPSSVTITQGGSSVSFDITIVDDSEVDGRQLLSITGTSPGFILGVDAMDVADNELDHFEFGSVETQQLAGVAFPITLTAVNIDDEPIGSYTNVVSLDAVGDAGVLPSAPDSLQGFTNGQWSGEVVVNAIDNNVVLIADDGVGIEGTSTVFNVMGPKIIITPSELTNTLVVVDESVTRTMIISNAGNIDLEFSILGLQEVLPTLNLVRNGDFEDGDTGFTTDYTYNPSGSQPGVFGKYYVGDDSKAWNGNIPEALHDHTTGSGLMLLADGSTTNGAIVWQQDVDVIGGTAYEFSAWVASIFTAGLPTLEFRVDGQSVGTIATRYNIWEQFAESWTASSSGRVTLSIRSTSTAAMGNDFAIDDILFRISPSLASGLIAHYPFNGNANDESGNGHDGTINGATLTTNRFGNANSAYHFDGTNDNIEVVDSTDLRLNNTSFSISTWFYETARNQSHADALISKRGTGSNNGWYYCISGTPSGLGAGKMVYQVSAGNDPLADSNATVPLNSWTHSVMTYDLASETARIYINGVLDSTHLNIPVPNALADVSLVIGMDGALSSYTFNGIIDDVRIYNRALSGGEIDDLYNESTSDFTSSSSIAADDISTGLIAHYPFNGNANDESGSGYDGTVNGATLTTDRFGNTNSAYHFDGIDDFINMGDVLDREDNDWTCSAWYRVQDYDRLGVILSKGLTTYGTPPNSGYGLSVYGGSSPIQELRFLVGNDTSGIAGYASQPLSSLPTNEYVFVTGVYEYGSTSAVVRLYVNGVQVSSNSIPAGVSDSNIPFAIGALYRGIYGATDFYFKGDVDDMRIYNRALPATEILELYNGSTPTNYWLSAIPLTGTVPPGGSMPITVRFDAEGLTIGDYLSDVLKIASNDALAPTNALPASMWVMPPAPVMIKEPEYTFGLSNTVAWSAIDGPINYLVESISSMGEPDQQSGWISATNYTFGSLSTNTVYFYRAKASVTNGVYLLESAWSDWVWSVQEADLGDADSDSLPNWWEQMYFGGITNSNPLLDSDGDGFSNLQEYISGMNPTNAWSLFMIEGVDSPITTNGVIEIWWDSVIGRTYSVYWKETLTNSFDLIESHIQYPRNSYIDSTHTNEITGFYMIEVELPGFPPPPPPPGGPGGGGPPGPSGL